MRERRNEILLGGLLLVFAIVLWYRLAGGAEEQPFGTDRRGGATPVNLDSIQLYPIDWDVLTAARPAYDPSGRNIFQFGKPPAPKVPELSDAEKAAIEKAREEANRKRQEAMKAAAPPPRPPEKIGPPEAPVKPPPPKPKPPTANYKFIGYFGPPDRKIAVLLDGSDQILGRTGDEIGDDFRILEIGYESIKFGFTDETFKDEYQIVPMTSGG